jgi:hypothetical protein
MMAERKKVSDSCFNEFDDISPKRKDPSIQVLYDYEKHYMELVRKFSPEITMIVDMLSDFRNEQELFYKKVLPEIIEKLNQDVGIDNEMRNVWLKRLTTNMDRSFGLSETLINDYATKSIDEFKASVNEKLRKL